MICNDETHESIIHDAEKSWYELLRCHHVRCENAEDEEAVFVINFVIETRKIEKLRIVNVLIQIDAEKEKKRKKKWCIEVTIRATTIDQHAFEHEVSWISIH